MASFAIPLAAKTLMTAPINFSIILPPHELCMVCGEASLRNIFDATDVCEVALRTYWDQMPPERLCSCHLRVKRKCHREVALAPGVLEAADPTQVRTTCLSKLT